jgi:muconate cycloisomerase
MKIDRVNIFKVSLPLTGDFSHARRNGASSENIVVEILVDQEGLSGYGEGAPRPFVTGESQESAASGARRLIQRSGTFPWDLQEIGQVWDFVDSLPGERDDNSAICALETALLDLLGRGQGRGITEYFPKDHFTPTICYSAGVPLTTSGRVAEICRTITGLTINRVKLKMGLVLEENAATFRAFRSVFESDYDLRIDVNGAWTKTTALAHLPVIRENRVKIVEQPLLPDDSGLGEVATAMKDAGITLMADESACAMEEIQAIVQRGLYRMINVRLSKFGGFRRSLKIIELLRDGGVAFQVGAQLAESGILSAAGRALGLLCRDSRYYDGSYDRFLLKENITTENVSFGPGGKAGPLDGVGLGVDVDRTRLIRLSTGMDTVMR